MSVLHEKLYGNAILLVDTIISLVGVTIQLVLAINKMFSQLIKYQNLILQTE